MRFALVAVLVSACARTPHEPAWPAPHARDADGGESLAPHEARVVAVVSKGGGAEDDKPVGPAATASPAATATTATAAAVTPPAAASDETIQTEEIIIEIDD